MRSHPAKYGETFDGPPTLERSGSERRGGAVSSLFPEGERVGVRGGALFNGKEGRGDFRKKLPLAKDFANERNESLLSNCRVQLILSKGRRRDSKDSFFNGKESYIQGNTSGKRKKQLYHSFNY